jgi:hypothetical protein
MKIAPHSLRAVAGPLVVMLTLFAAPTLAQEEEQDEEPSGLYLEAGTWIAQPKGTEFFPATVTDQNNPFDAELLGMSFGTETAGRFRLGWVFGKSYGGIIATYYGQSPEDSTLSGRSPGEFVYGQIQNHPLYAGYRNDGLSDAFEATAGMRLRDFRLDYFNRAFRSPRVRGNWLVGYRNIDVERQFSVEYPTLLNDLPAFIPPFCTPSTPEEEGDFPQCYPNLVPQTDVATMESNYSGRGIEAGMDFEVPFLRNRMQLEAGFVFAVLRGDIRTQYRSTTHVYTLDGVLLAWPYDVLGESLPPENPGDPPIPVADFADQVAFDIALGADSLSATSTIFEVNLGLRFKVWRDLDVFFGLRSANYDNVGVDYRPKVLVLDVNSNLQTVEETDRSVTYEGFYLGMSYQF